MANNLHDAMRRLWTDHVVWTRQFIVSALAGLPDVKFAENRLMANQEDIGNAIAKFYGRDAGNKLTALLKEHIAIAADAVMAAKASKVGELNHKLMHWQRNANDISTFLSQANPNWPFNAVQAMMMEHLRLTYAEASSRIEGNWARDIQAFDAILTEILGMADALSDGITKQFSPSMEQLTQAMQGLCCYRR